MDEQKPRRFAVVKSVENEAKILGLNYVSFFVFLFLSILISMLSFSQGLVGIIIGLLFLAALYFTLIFLQVRLGPKQLNKIKNNFLDPIPIIKVKSSFRKLYK